MCVCGACVDLVVSYVKCAVDDMRPNGSLVSALYPRRVQGELETTKCGLSIYVFKLYDMWAT